MILEHKDFSYKFDANKCSQCEGNCCIGESGYIWITPKEIGELAKFLNISEQELFAKYVFKQGYKFSIKEKQLDQNNFACVFFDLDKKQCSIYDVRPTQCRTFPFWDYFKNKVNEVKEECPAIID
jgi:Fe-S-cluster containining protein